MTIKNPQTLGNTGFLGFTGSAVDTGEEGVEPPRKPLFMRARGLFVKIFVKIIGRTSDL